VAVCHRFVLYSVCGILWLGDLGLIVAAQASDSTSRRTPAFVNCFFEAFGAADPLGISADD